MPPEQPLDDVPLVAILRGVTPDRVVEIGEALHEAGIRAIEVPLNSPDPFRSIERLAARLGDICLCGAGTVLSSDQVERARDAGARLIVAPNTDVSVIARAVRHGLVVVPGFATATEAFAAIAAGATRLKLFPASTYGAGHLKALKAVLPRDVKVYAVGGIGPADMQQWAQAGAAGFGLGSDIFKPEYETKDIAMRARQAIAAIGEATAKT
ncbi:MAG TPA: 2-dehydro-3-deoxy-6-phosphogalactonate aldolase [Rhizomicrobium sp.]|nr:2-dehydro-3-deoxy-6-phosphogalactonate aldolase [Rhizomicrobium sp.]